MNRVPSLSLDELPGRSAESSTLIVVVSKSHPMDADTSSRLEQKLMHATGYSGHIWMLIQSLGALQGKEALQG